MFQWLRNLVARRPAGPEPAEPGPLLSVKLRRWEAAETNRLNQAHWQNVTGNSINVDLQAKLETLRTRAALELANNPILEGVIYTHQTDVVGPEGPTLQVQSDDTAYNDALEAVFGQWRRNPVIGKPMSLGELLRLWVRRLWDCGEFLAQKATKMDAPGPVKFRLKPIHPRRLDTPAGMAGDADVAMGVRRTRDGEPTQYYIQNPKPWGVYALDTGNYDPIPADMIVHRFVVQEEDQVRGVPFVACVLDVIAELRDYDAQVLDAARQAADMAVFWYAEHPDAEYLKINETAPIERRMQQTGPPGWKPQQLVPTQPSTQYVDYRHERMAEIGRPVCMPLMMVRLTSEDHNYSSARFDGQIYLRALRTLQAFLTVTLDELVDEIARESALAGALPRRPAAVRYEWTWPVPPHVDPKKENEADDIALRNGSAALSDVLAKGGGTLDGHIATMTRDNEKLAAAGLPTYPLPDKKAAAGASGDEDDDEDAKKERSSAKRREQARALNEKMVRSWENVG